MKGIINIVELIFVLAILFIAFGVLLPGFSYRSKWSTAYLLLISRDAITTIDRLNKIHEYSFNSSLLNDFIENVTPTSRTNIIWWPEIEGTFKDRIYISCNCTDEQITYLSNWFANLRINSRQINLVPCKTNLDTLNLCGPSNNPEVLLIWGYKDLTPYSDALKDYLRRENGIVEIMDFDQAADEAQKSVFGVDTGGAWSDVDYATILKPDSLSNITYQPYKIFYHSPAPLEAFDSGIPVGCTLNATGNFTLWNTNYMFSICDGSTVYFDKDANNSLDPDPLVKGSQFSLKKINNPQGFYNFTLNYIEYDRIGVSFKPAYNFSDFCKDLTKNRAIPVNNEAGRVFVQSVRGDSVGAYCSILNGTISRTAWVANFSRNGLNKVNDDHVQMLISLILWASNKRSTSAPSSQIKTGFISTYINTVNEDMFEVYKFKLGMGYPY